MLIPLIRFGKEYSGGFSLANHKSAAKRARQSIRKQNVNSRRKSSVKTHEKNLVKAIEAKDLKALPGLLKTFMAQAAKGAQKGVFKKETASRKVGRLSARASALLGK
jgi:small subunit ribosomal protein S20